MRMLVPSMVFGLVGAAHADCPTPVKQAIDKAFPKASISKCAPENEHGRDQFEVVLVRAGGGRVEVDVAPDGRILLIEEPIALDQVPAAVMKAFAARYPKAKATSAEKQSPTGAAPNYELAFAIDGKRREATFTTAGAFVEEE
jgi:hypothetical protein